MFAPPAVTTRLPRAGWQEEAGTAHDEATRVDLVSDWHSVAGRSVGLWQQQRRSVAHADDHDVSRDGSDDQRLADVSVGAGEQ
ncbi:MAG: hypothetical protein ACTHJH_15935 [Marmoricola sp.]